MEAEDGQRTHRGRKIQVEKVPSCKDSPRCNALHETEDSREGAREDTRHERKRRLDHRRSATEFQDRPVKRTRISQPEPKKGDRACRRRQPRRKVGRPRMTRVAKRRDSRPCTCSKCLRKPVCRKHMANFCVYVVNKRIGTDMCPLDKNKPVAVLTPQPRSLQSSNHSIGTHSKPASSYNSFYSSGHQPME